LWSKIKRRKRLLKDGIASKSDLDVKGRSRHIKGKKKYSSGKIHRGKGHAMLPEERNFSNQREGKAPRSLFRTNLAKGKTNVSIRRKQEKTMKARKMRSHRKGT